MMNLLFICCFMLIAARDRTEVNNLKTLLDGKFEIKDLGATKKIFGMKIHKNQRIRKLYLS